MPFYYKNAQMMLIYTVSHKKSQLIFICNFVKNRRILM